MTTWVLFDHAGAAARGGAAPSAQSPHAQPAQPASRQVDGSRQSCGPPAPWRRRRGASTLLHTTVTATTAASERVAHLELPVLLQCQHTAERQLAAWLRLRQTGIEKVGLSRSSQGHRTYPGQCHARCKSNQNCPTAACPPAAQPQPGQRREEGGRPPPATGGAALRLPRLPVPYAAAAAATLPSSPPAC